MNRHVYIVVKYIVTKVSIKMKFVSMSVYVSMQEWLRAREKENGCICVRVDRYICMCMYLSVCRWLWIRISYIIIHGTGETDMQTHTHTHTQNMCACANTHMYTWRNIRKSVDRKVLGWARYSRRMCLNYVFFF